MKETLFKSEEIKKRQDVAEIFRQIADKIEEGNILLKKGGDEVSVDLPEKMEVEIKASRKDKKGVIERELEIELEWKEGESGPVSIE